MSRTQDRTLGPHATLMETVSDSLARKMNTSSLQEVILWDLWLFSSCNGRPLSTVSPPCSWDCAWRHANPAIAHTDVSSWRGLGFLCVLWVTKTLTEQKTREESVSKDRERSNVWVYHMQKLSPLGKCQCFASPFHLFLLSFAPKQEKLIHNHLCLLKRLISLYLNDLVPYCVIRVPLIFWSK